MKVYQVNVVCQNGSTGRIVADLSKVIEEYGSECRIAYGRGDTPKDINAVCITNKLEVYYHVLMTRLTGKHGLYSKKATERLIADIKAYKPDIVHLHNIHGYYVNYKALFEFLKDYSKPVVWTLHDCWAFTGQCAHFESVNCTKWKNGGCKKCPKLNTYPKTLTGKNVKKNFREKQYIFNSLEKLVLVTPSKWLKNEIRHSCLRDIESVWIPNGIDPTVFKYRESSLKERLGLNEKKIVLGVAGVWTKEKGFNDILKLREKLSEEYSIILVGLSKKQKKTLPKGIVGIEKTKSSEELAKYYSVADVFINLTYEDTFPTTNIEAIACETPVITYKTGGSTEIVADNCGYVVPKGNVQEVATIITAELKERSFYKMSCNKRASELKKEENYRKYVELYKKVLNRQL